MRSGSARPRIGTNNPVIDKRPHDNKPPREDGSRPRHRSCQRASVQLSENARAQVLNGLPSRWVGNGRPFA